MHLFIEQGVKGGICCVPKRYSKANNEFCSDYDKTKPKVYIKYLDMNNLYGKAMSEYLPYGGFKWVEVNNESVNKILKRSENSLHGYFLEVDLECPENLHNIHNNLPMAPEKIRIKDEMLSPIQLEIKSEYGIKVGITNKLVPNLMPKQKYVIYYRNLKCYLLKGWILKKVRKILEF